MLYFDKESYFRLYPNTTEREWEFLSNLFERCESTHSIFLGYNDNLNLLTSSHLSSCDEPNGYGAITMINAVYGYIYKSTEKILDQYYQHQFYTLPPKYADKEYNCMSYLQSQLICKLYQNNTRCNQFVFLSPASCALLQTSTLFKPCKSSYYGDLIKCGEFEDTPIYWSRFVKDNYVIILINSIQRPFILTVGECKIFEEDNHTWCRLYLSVRESE